MDQKQREFVDKTLEGVLTEAAKLPRKTLELKYACSEVNQSIAINMHNDFIKQIQDLVEGEDAIDIVMGIQDILPMRDEPPVKPEVALDVIRNEDDNSK